MSDGAWTLVGTFAGALITAVGWIIKERSAERAHAKEAELAYLDAQINGFYGPLLGLVQQDSDLYKVVQGLIPSMPDSRQGFKLDGDPEKIWVFFTDNYFLPCHKQIRDLLYAKSHLRDYEIDQGGLAKDIDAFLRYAADLQYRQELYVKLRIATDYPGQVYPSTLLSNAQAAIRKLADRRKWLNEMKPPNYVRN
jgi:hypothetical protein